MFVNGEVSESAPFGPVTVRRERRRAEGRMCWGAGHGPGLLLGIAWRPPELVLVGDGVADAGSVAFVLVGVAAANGGVGDRLSDD